MTQYQTEKGFQDAVVQLAIVHGWMFYHGVHSQRSEPGFPDLVLVRPPIVIFAELKKEKGKLTTGRMNKAGSRWLPGQDDWGEALEACDGVLYFLWRPSDWDEIEDILEKKVGRTPTARLSGGE